MSLNAQISLILEQFLIYSQQRNKTYLGSYIIMICIWSSEFQIPYSLFQIFLQ